MDNRLESSKYLVDLQKQCIRKQYPADQQITVISRTVAYNILQINRLQYPESQKTREGQWEKVSSKIVHDRVQLTSHISIYSTVVLYCRPELCRQQYPITSRPINKDIQQPKVLVRPVDKIVAKPKSILYRLMECRYMTKSIQYHSS